MARRQRPEDDTDVRRMKWQPCEGYRYKKYANREKSDPKFCEYRYIILSKNYKEMQFGADSRERNRKLSGPHA